MKKLSYTLLMALMTVVFFSCSSGNENQDDSTDTTAEVEEVSDDPMENMGIGPISSVDLAELDDAEVAVGEELFESKCSACHKVDKQFVGPSMAGILERRSPEWVMNMILNPEQMVEEDPIAMELLAEYLSPMANQSLTEQEARSILEFFRTL
ncbi:MAG: cytochrome c [Bacteroidia bacterium]